MTSFKRLAVNLLCFFAAAFLSGWATWASAEDYPAIAKYGIVAGSNPCNFAGEVGTQGAVFSDPASPITQCISQWDARSTGATNGTWGYSESPYDGWPHCSGQSGYSCAVNVWKQDTPPNGPWSWWVAAFSVVKVWTCPGGGSLASGATVMIANCTGAPACPSGQVRDSSGQCQAQPTTCPSVGTDQWLPCSGNGCSVSTICSQGCQWSGKDAVWSSRGDQSGSVLAHMSTAQNVGALCSVGSDTQLNVGGAPVPPTPVPGSCYGTVNGVETYLPCDKSSTTKTSSSCKDANGNPCDPSNPPGNSTSQSGSSKTTCTGNACSTTTTTTTNTCTNGSCTTTTGISTQSKGPGDPTDMGSFCKDNPTSPMCAVKTASGGTNCTTPPSSSGDAIEGAILLQTWKTQCALNQESDENTLYGQAAAGNDPQKGNYPTDPSKVTVKTFDSGTISQATFLGSSCPADKPVTMGAYSFSIPFSRWCDVLGYMGLVVVAFSMLAASKIVGVW